MKHTDENYASGEKIPAMNERNAHYLTDERAIRQIRIIIQAAGKTNSQLQVLYNIASQLSFHFSWLMGEDLDLSLKSCDVSPQWLVILATTVSYYLKDKNNEGAAICFIRTNGIDAMLISGQ